MTNLFADTLMIASRMESFESTGMVARRRRISAPWTVRVRRWFVTGAR